MKKLWAYYLVILVPFVLLLVAAKASLLSSTWFVVLLFLYFIFRQFTDAARLHALGLINKPTLKTIADPFLQGRYFKALYFSTK